MKKKTVRSKPTSLNALEKDEKENLRDWLLDIDLLKCNKKGRIIQPIPCNYISLGTSRLLCSVVTWLFLLKPEPLSSSRL